MTITMTAEEFLILLDVYTVHRRVKRTVTCVTDAHHAHVESQVKYKPDLRPPSSDLDVHVRADVREN